MCDKCVGEQIDSIYKSVMKELKSDNTISNYPFDKKNKKELCAFFYLIGRIHQQEEDSKQMLRKLGIFTGNR